MNKLERWLLKHQAEIDRVVRRWLRALAWFVAALYLFAIVRHLVGGL